MRARWLDPQGSLLVRTLPVVSALAASSAAFFLGVTLGGWDLAGLFLVLAAPLVISLVPWLRSRAPRDVELVLGPGRVDVKDGLRTTRIRARSVIGASTAKTARGLVLTLAVHRRLAPVNLELATEAEADEVRRALGVGHGGVGAVGWTPSHDGMTRAPALARAAAAVMCVVMYLLGASNGPALFELLLMFASYLAPALVLAATPLLKIQTGGRTIAMQADGLHVRIDKVAHQIPYASIHDVRVEPSRVVVVSSAVQGELALPRRARSAGGVGLTDAEASVLRAQILAAVARARGFATPKEETAARLETLRRDRNEGSYAWLVRLDGLGKTLVTGVGGYRGASLDANDLWGALEDPDGDPELRVACARVLRAAGLPEARVRIATAVEATRDERLLTKLRVVSDEDDVNEAGEALAAIEQRERDDAERLARRA